jgi:hypothetical protein
MKNKFSDLAVYFFPVMQRYLLIIFRGNWRATLGLLSETGSFEPPTIKELKEVYLQIVSLMGFFSNRPRCFAFFFFYFFFFFFCVSSSHTTTLPSLHCTLLPVSLTISSGQDSSFHSPDGDERSPDASSFHFRSLLQFMGTIGNCLRHVSSGPAIEISSSISRRNT